MRKRMFKKQKGLCHLCGETMAISQTRCDDDGFEVRSSCAALAWWPQCLRKSAARAQTLQRKARQYAASVTIYIRKVSNERAA